jgi:hypothetical protein
MAGRQLQASPLYAKKVNVATLKSFQNGFYNEARTRSLMSGLLLAPKTSLFFRAARQRTEFSKTGKLQNSFGEIEKGGEAL